MLEHIHFGREGISNDKYINVSNSLSGFPTEDMIGLMACGLACCPGCCLFFFLIRREINRF